MFIVELIKKVSIEDTQMAISKFTSVLMNVEMIVAEADAFENGDIGNWCSNVLG
jgi:hypothetical protein